MTTEKEPWARQPASDTCMEANINICQKPHRSSIFMAKQQQSSWPIALYTSKKNQFSLQSGRNHSPSPWVFVCGGFSSAFVPWIETPDFKHTAVERKDLWNASPQCPWRALMDHGKPTAKDLSSHSPALWEHLSSAKLGAFQGRIKAAIPPPRQMKVTWEERQATCLLVTNSFLYKILLSLLICRSITMFCGFKFVFSPPPLFF